MYHSMSTGLSDAELAATSAERLAAQQRRVARGEPLDETRYYKAKHDGEMRPRAAYVPDDNRKGKGLYDFIKDHARLDADYDDHQLQRAARLKLSEAPKLFWRKKKAGPVQRTRQTTVIPFMDSPLGAAPFRLAA